MTMRYIFLDDERDPTYLGDGNPDRWEVFRTAEDLLKVIPSYLREGPVSFSLDHDLGEDILTGYDFLNMLVELHLDDALSLQNVSVQVHSANPVGKVNIEKLWSNFQKAVLNAEGT